MSNFDRQQQGAQDIEFDRTAGVWRGFLADPPQIRVAARCIVRRTSDGAILVIEAYDEHKDERFFIVPGGGLRFGETSIHALAREMSEEFKTAITDLRLVTTIENHFIHRATPGHEVIFIYTGALVDQSLYTRPSIPLIDGGEALTASWRPSTSFRSDENPDGPPLYPDGLLAVIREFEGEGG